MKAKLFFSQLRERSEQLRKLSTELSANLETLGQALGEQDISASVDGEFLDWFAEFNGALSTTTDMFRQRLRTFLESARPQLPGESPQPPEDRSTLRYATLTAKAQEVVDEAREIVAHSHQLFEQSRNTLQDTEELFQYLQARRDREAEQPPASYSLPCSTAEDANTPSKPQPSSESAPKNESG